MARGDGKARKGFTRATTPRSDGVKRMSLGGFMGGQPESARSSSGLGGSTREGGFAGAGSRPGGSSGGGGLAGSTRDGGMRPGGSGQMGGGGEGPRGLAGSTREGGFGGTRPSGPSGGSAAGQLARLGSDPARAMTGAGINSGRAQMLAGVYNDLAQQDLRDPSIRGTSIQSLTPKGKIADRLEMTPDWENPYMAPAGEPVPRRSMPARPVTPTPQRPAVMPSRPFSPTPTQASPAAPSFRPSYLDQQSVVPGSVTFTQSKQFTPFAETDIGQSLLARSQKPMTAQQAAKFAKQLPEGSVLIGSGLAGLRYPTPSGFDESAYNSYPAKIAGYNFNVSVPKGAGVTSLGPKVGSFNPASPYSSQSFGSIKDQSRLPGMSGETVGPEFGSQFLDKDQSRLPGMSGPTEGPVYSGPAGSQKPTTSPSVVAAGDRASQSNFSSSGGPFRDRPGGGEDKEPIRRRGKKHLRRGAKPKTMKSGGRVAKADGIASRGKTKGRCV